MKLRKVSLAAVAERAELASSVGDPAAVIADREEFGRLRELVGRLPSADLAILDAVTNNRPKVAVAAELGCTVRTVERRGEKVLERLRTVLSRSIR